MRTIFKLFVLFITFGGYLSYAAPSHPQPPEAAPDIKALNRSFSDQDAAAFHNPDKVFHPETWFHFIGGNVAPQGITADLEAISKAGISGIQLFHGQFGGAWPGVEPQVKCLSELWDSAIGHVAKECQRLGLRFTMQNCPGWAMSGGPWITPDKAMRHLVWSRTDISGGKTNPAPSLPVPQPSREDWRDYRDILVLAFPVPDGDTGRALVPISIKSNRENLPWEKCIKNEPDGKISLEPGREPAWVEASFKEPVTLRTIQFPAVQSFNHGWSYVPGVKITVHAVLSDGLHEVAQYDMPQSNWQDNKPISLACSDAVSDTYRITIDNQHSMTFSSMQLFTGARKNNWEGEAAWVLRSLMKEPHPKQTETAWIDPSRILVLTEHMDAEGKLNWNAPAGKWTVLRFGHVNSGKRNGPAPAEATGWECNKLSPIGAETHFAGYIGRLSGEKGPASGGLLQGMLLDSWECETQTWTPDMNEQFEKLNGYHLPMWFPALAGYVIKDPETTTRFLRDWRATINRLLVDNFFGRMTELGHEKGLAISFETASGDVFPADILEYYKHADVPMCEFWQPRTEAFVGSFEFKPIKPCASAAHLYGKPRVAAEAFTSFALRWNEHPGMLKDIANMHFAEGVTHLIFHTYTHNPRIDFLPPGTAFGAGIGTPFLRGQTWWTEMPDFTDYLARCGYLLERGRPVADVLWYLGDEIDHKPSQNAIFPKGYHYDYCNPDILLNRLSVKDGKIVTSEGLRYSVLWMRDCKRMLPETLEQMVALVKKGAVLVGDRPEALATLSGGEETEKRFLKAIESLWGKKDQQGKRNLGKGLVISGTELNTALQDLGIVPDVTGDDVVWSHRQTKDADWYFIAANAQKGFLGTLGFRATGVVEVWNPSTGEVTPAEAVRREGSISLVALNLPPSGSAFVVFRNTKNKPSTVIRVEHNGTIVMDTKKSYTADVPGPIVISASYGAPDNIELRKDVTDTVRKALADGEKSVTPNNSWAGGDPALDKRKQLFVELQQPDGQKTSLNTWEGESLQLTESSVISMPACNILDSGRSLLAWEPGRYNVTHQNGISEIIETTTASQTALTGSWTLSFPDGWGAPEKLLIDKLVSWTELELAPEARAFSGTVVYTTEFSAGELEADAKVNLDLGNVEVIASVYINDKHVGTLWSPPYRLDVTDAIESGLNRLTIKVTSSWFNRLVYDAGLPENERKTWTIAGPGKNAKPQQSGLLGPVILRVGSVLSLKSEE